MTDMLDRKAPVVPGPRRAARPTPPRLGAATRSPTPPTIRETVAAIRAHHAELLALTPKDFALWCRDLAALRTHSVHGLLPALFRQSRATGRAFEVDPRYTALQRAEHAAVDHLDRDQLQAMLAAHRLTRDQAEYWARSRPWELPDPPPWIAPTLVDEID
jgi:hypothetical protein